MTDVDVQVLAASRRYPVFGPEDDDFHDEVISDRWWETETNWFSWNVPERKMGGWTYCQARPNARLCNGGAWVWDPSGAEPWELPYHVNYSGLRLPDRAERDMRDFEWPNGVAIKALEPLSRYRIDYDDPGGLEVHLVFEATMAPNPHPVGVAPFLLGTHFDQAGRLTGEMVLRGERIAVDCFSVRDRSWGPRPGGRPKKRRLAEAELSSGTGGVGYSFAVAGPDAAWLVYSIPAVDADPVTCGFLVRDGCYAHVLTGERHLDMNPETGWAERISLWAIDDMGRRLDVEGHAQSRHWRGPATDTLMMWEWDGLTAWGEDQTHLSHNLWQAYRERAGR